MADEQQDEQTDARSDPGHSRDNIGIKPAKDGPPPQGGGGRPMPAGRGRDAVSDQADGADGPLP
ncbi:MAG: hypothetical protein EOO40_10795 [Deltaproteobacteria bacterium]|nr:MAG: hypothetical protein EOO40_10795 [Deltaproteobacteria bacterium]